MTKRWKRIGIGVSVVALVGVLFLPGVHWRLYGWVYGEPFWRNRPVSYWRGKAATGMLFPLNTVSQASGDSAPTVRVSDASFVESDVGPFARARRLVLGWFGRPVMSPLLEPVFPPGDPDAVPILVRLLNDDMPKVRFGAVKALEQLGPPTPNVLEALRRRTDDTAELGWGLTVGAAAKSALRKIGPNASGEADHP